MQFLSGVVAKWLQLVFAFMGVSDVTVLVGHGGLQTEQMLQLFIVMLSNEINMFGLKRSIPMFFYNLSLLFDLHLFSLLGVLFRFFLNFLGLSPLLVHENLFQSNHLVFMEFELYCNLHVLFLRFGGRHSHVSDARGTWFWHWVVIEQHLYRDSFFEGQSLDVGDGAICFKQLSLGLVHGDVGLRRGTSLQVIISCHNIEVVLLLDQVRHHFEKWTNIRRCHASPSWDWLTSI